MCYSAQIQSDYRRYCRDFGAVLGIEDFVDLFWWRWSPEEISRRRGRPRLPKMMEQAFLGEALPGTPPDDLARLQQIRGWITEARERDALEWQAELFKQRKRLADAERSLQSKTTRKAQEDQRIAGDKVERLKGWLADLSRTRIETRDERIYPQHYAPVLVMEGGQRVVRPMRYQCRPAGSPAAFDQQFPGTYNARRDKLEGRFWKPLFAATRGLMLISAFYENVDRHKAEGRELAEGELPTNQVLEFRPQPAQPMLVACLWSRWTAPGARAASEAPLLSFAAITDEPPAEVAAAGHDRCVVPIRPEHIDAWLDPALSDPAALYRILDDRERPYYEHRLAA